MVGWVLTVEKDGVVGVLEKIVVLEPERPNFSFLPLVIFNYMTFRKISDLSEEYYSINFWK